MTTHDNSLHLVPGERRDELTAIVALLRFSPIGSTRLIALLDHYGSAVEVIPRLPKVGATSSGQLALAGLTAADLRSARAEVDGWQSHDLDVRTILDAAYPVNLQAVHDRPPLLFIRGEWDESKDSRAIAVVGTRIATPEGTKRAYRLAKGLAAAGVTVISGLAKGIDSFAHLGALRAGGRTVAVVGTGIDRVYPAEHTALADSIVAAGCAIVSQFFPGHAPRKWTFPLRNVTMSGLSIATVVVEAGATSGAKMQAEAALRHGRAVFLPSSLVRAHKWARQLVSEGIAGTAAVEISSTDQLLDYIDLAATPPGALTA